MFYKNTRFLGTLSGFRVDRTQSGHDVIFYLNHNLLGFRVMLPCRVPCSPDNGFLKARKLDMPARSTSVGVMFMLGVGVRARSAQAIIAESQPALKVTGSFTGNLNLNRPGPSLSLSLTSETVTKIIMIIMIMLPA